MAAKVFIQNPNHSQILIRDNITQRKHNLDHCFLPKKASKRLVVSSSVMSPPITSPPLAPLSPVAPPVRAIPPLSRVWREIQGSNNWECLIDPLSPLLQQEITRYGNLLSATYKGFDLDPNSKRYLNCKYGKTSLLKESGIHDPHGYQVTKYIYATPDHIKPIQNQPNRARWIGYVAVSSDDSVKRLGRRDVVVTFRGTVTNPEWLANLMSFLTPTKLDPHNPREDVKVESGFLSLYTSNEMSESKFGLRSCREQLLSEISRLINKYKDEEMSITLVGHSMGSSLAHLLAYDIGELGMNKRRGEEAIPTTVFSFGGPRVGNLEFKKRCEELGVKVLRITNVNDPITKLPGVLFNENFRALGGVYEFPWSCSCYTHVGVELTLDFFDVQNISCVHDLDTYISLVNRPRRSRSPVEEDNFGGKVLNRTSEVMFGKGESQALRIRNAATKAVYLLASLSNHMLYYNII